MIKSNLLVALLLSFTSSIAQFHTLNFPQASARVEEHQKLGVTDIIINYGSPALNGRDVWNNAHIIPQNGEPIAWRAGANMNTTISFSTDVMVEGNLLKAGKYGFHIIPKEGKYTLLFAHNNDQWGSYYLDIENDVTLSVDVESTSCPNSEQLDYEFLDRSENSLVIGLEWGELRIPFNVEVDLNKTVVASFRSELRGINTYHWQAWNDAASWCLNHDTNLEEALAWANRSISGGSGGFAANKNVSNMVTKIQLLKKLNKTNDVAKAMEEVKMLSPTQQESNEYSRFLIRNKYYKEAIDYCDIALKQQTEAWPIELNKGLAYYFVGNKKAAISNIKKVAKIAPAQLSTRLGEVMSEMEAGTYKLPARY